MPVTKKQGPQPQVQINSNETKVVQMFVYLGGETDANGSCDAEMRRRMVLVGSVMNRLSMSIFRRHDVSLDLKLRLYNSYVLSQYSHTEVSHGLSPRVCLLRQTAHEDMENRLDACENRWLRRIMWITYKDRITNESIRQRTQQVPVSNSIRQMRLKWLGHVSRMKDNRLTKSVRQWKPTGKDQEDDQTTDLNERWMDCTEGDLRRAGVTKCGKTAGRQRMTLNDIVADRQHGGT